MSAITAVRLPERPGESEEHPDVPPGLILRGASALAVHLPDSAAPSAAPLKTVSATARDAVSSLALSGSGWKMSTDDNPRQLMALRCQAGESATLRR
jgi:hypothetical protein